MRGPVCGAERPPSRLAFLPARLVEASLCKTFGVREHARCAPLHLSCGSRADSFTSSVPREDHP